MNHYAPFLYAGIVWGILAFCFCLLFWKLIFFGPTYPKDRPNATHATHAEGEARPDALR